MQPNSKTFTPEEVKQGLLNDLLKYLIDYNKKSEKYYYDIHITTDGCCTIVEWTDCSYEFHYDNSTFQFVDENHRVAYIGTFPDNSQQIFLDESEYNESLKEWLEENPGWKKNEYGSWYHEDDTKSLQ